MLVDRKKFMKVCDWVVDENPWFHMAYELYEAGMTMTEVHELQKAYVYPRPRFDGDWSEYSPVEVMDIAMHVFCRLYLNGGNVDGLRYNSQSDQ